MREREGILDARIGKFPSIKAVAVAAAAAAAALLLARGTDGHMKYLFTRARALWSFPLSASLAAPPPADTLLVYYICA